MDQITLVDRRIDDGQKLILQLARDGVDVLVAFWLRPSEDGWWHLYVASKLVDREGPRAGYRKVQASLQHLPGLSISLGDIKVIEATAPLTHDVLKIRKWYTGTTPIRFGGAQLGGLLVEEAVIYPALPTAKRGGFYLGKRRLKSAVRQTVRMDDLLAPLTPLESHALGQIVASGISPAQADYWVRKRREMEKEKQDIPPGTVVDAYVTAWWGDKSEDDPNPLVRVETAEGAQGLTFLNNTEPI
jgi:hypothetical protein